MNTTYFLNQVMGNMFHTKTNPGIPANYYIGLTATEPSISGENKGEPSMSGTGYSRVLLSSLSEPADGVIKNTAVISFDESITDWGIMTHYTVYDAQTGGNLLFYGPLSLIRNVEPNTVITIRTGELSIQLCNPSE